MFVLTHPGRTLLLESNAFADELRTYVGPELAQLGEKRFAGRSIGSVGRRRL